MNPGVTEEGGEVAKSLISNLKDSPVTLALVLFNVVFLVVIFFSMRDQRNRTEQFQDRLFDQQSKTMEMLYNCTPNPKPLPLDKPSNDGTAPP
jgi:uncharacterized membrane protein affecting hemolysin expression